MIDVRVPEVPIGIGEEQAAVGDHIAYFWENDEEFERAVGFLETGLRADDHCVVFGYQEANRRVLGLLEEKGFEPDELVAAGRLSVVGGRPDPEAMLEEIGATFQEALDRGAPLVRLLGNIGWTREGWPDEHGCLVFEAKVTGAAAGMPSVVMCMYDVRNLPGEIVLHGAFETHPLTFHGNVIRENPCFTPIEQFLSRIRRNPPERTSPPERRSADPRVERPPRKSFRSTN